MDVSRRNDSIISQVDAQDAPTRVLLLPPTVRDGEAVGKVLKESGIDCAIYRTMSELCAAIDKGAGAVVVSEESLNQGAERMAQCVAKQPVWSDLPVLVLSRAGAESPRLASTVLGLGNVTVVERPLRITTLLSLIQAALRARRRQYEVRAHLVEIAHARVEAERAGRIKDEFLATLSHELRTPLNAILGWSQIIRRSNCDAADVEEGIEVIERNARVQTQIIEDLLDMSRIISGKMRLDVQPINLSDVIRAAAETIGPAANAKEIRVQLVLDPRAATISGDPNRLQQVFWNLLSNSIKFSPKGGRVQVLLERIDSHLEVSIIDSGDGIEPAFLPHVFDRFTQADAATTRSHGGLGLGLAIVKQLVELHGGTVMAKSPGRGQGSTFVVLLPLTPIHPDPQPVPQRRHPTADAMTSSAESCVQIAGVRVLVVDDEPDARALLRRVLEDCDAIVSAAPSVERAMAVLQTERPDVLISDIGMPGEDGYSLIRRVRRLSSDAGGSIPAIALTAYASSEDRVQSVLAGFQHHLAKPVEPAELVAMVASLVPRGGGSSR